MATNDNILSADDLAVIANAGLAADADMPVALFTGVKEPTNPGPNARWQSRSHRHLQCTVGKQSRIPIFGSSMGQGPSQEIAPWYNPILNRYEALINFDSAQWFSYTSDPLKGWSTPVRVLGVPGAGGAAAGGESGKAQQCNVYIENGVIYAFYNQPGGTIPILMASAPMPTNPANPPVFTKQGQVWTEVGGAIGSSFLIKVGGIYYLFIERGASIKLATSSAASAADFVSNPFTTISNALTLTIDMGVRTTNAFGRPYVVYEQSTGTWILYAHRTSSYEFGSDIFKWTSTDVGTPTTWVADKEQPYVRRVHPAYEVDQVADFRALQGANGVWYAFWSGNNNRDFTFSILASVMLEPVLAYDGVANWVSVERQADTKANLGYLNADGTSSNIDVKNGWEIFLDTSGGVIRATLPVAAVGSYAKVVNSPATRPGNQATVRAYTAAGSDVILSGNRVTSQTASGSVITAVTYKKHGLKVGDLCSMGGASPVLYNKTAATVASVVDDYTFTYNADGAPGSNTVLGYFEPPLEPGECREYKCYRQGIWVRN